MKLSTKVEILGKHMERLQGEVFLQFNRFFFYALHNRVIFLWQLLFHID